MCVCAYRFVVRDDNISFTFISCIETTQSYVRMSGLCNHLHEQACNAVCLCKIIIVFEFILNTCSLDASCVAWTFCVCFAYSADWVHDSYMIRSFNRYIGRLIEPMRTTTRVWEGVYWSHWTVSVYSHHIFALLCSERYRDTLCFMFAVVIRHPVSTF